MNAPWEAVLVIISISSVPRHVPLSHWTSLTKHKFQDKTIKTFKMAQRNIDPESLCKCTECKKKKGSHYSRAKKLSGRWADCRPIPQQQASFGDPSCKDAPSSVSQCPAIRVRDRTQHWLAMNFHSWSSELCERDWEPLKHKARELFSIFGNSPCF